MRIAVTVDPEIPVPPLLYGGIERMVAMLVQELTSRGHEVTLFAHPESAVRCRLEPYPCQQQRTLPQILRNMWHVSAKVRHHRFDIVHSFGRLLYLLPLLPLHLPKLMSYQRVIAPRSIRWGERLARGSLHFSAASGFMIQKYKDRQNFHVVYNGVEATKYRFEPKVSEAAPFVFLGRVEEIKGPHIAIEVARSTGRRLVIAGNVPPEKRHETFFDDKIRPHLDGDQVKYVGPVNDVQKNAILGMGAALLMPVLWDELFGIVMAEALACGTPVIAFDRGAIPEVVDEGVNGYRCVSVDDMISAAHRIGAIDRAACRRSVEEKFSDIVVVDAYEKVYAHMLRGTAS